MYVCTSDVPTSGRTVSRNLYGGALNFMFEIFIFINLVSYIFMASCSSASQ